LLVIVTRFSDSTSGHPTPNDLIDHQAPDGSGVQADPFLEKLLNFGGHILPWLSVILSYRRGGIRILIHCSGLNAFAKEDFAESWREQLPWFDELDQAALIRGHGPKKRRPICRDTWIDKVIDFAPDRLGRLLGQQTEEMRFSIGREIIEEDNPRTHVSFGGLA
jgi:hypothetical protein